MGVETTNGGGLTASDVTSQTRGPSVHNVQWDRPTVSTIRVRRLDSNQPAYYVARASDGTETIVAIDDTGLTWDITSTGALGGTRTGAEANSTCYEIYLVTDGSTPYLLSETVGTDLTFANLAALNAAYTSKTGVIGFGANDSSGDLHDIEGVNGSIRMISDYTTRPITTSFSSGTYVDQTATMDTLLPKKGIRRMFGYIAGGSTDTGIGISDDATDLVDFVVANPSAGARHIEWPGKASLHCYRWGGNNTFNLYASGVDL